MQIVLSVDCQPDLPLIFFRFWLSRAIIRQIRPQFYLIIKKTINVIKVKCHNRRFSTYEGIFWQYPSAEAEGKGVKCNYCEIRKYLLLNDSPIRQLKQTARGAFQIIGCYVIRQLKQTVKCCISENCSLSFYCSCTDSAQTAEEAYG